MDENRENQQYFFTQDCTNRLSELQPDLCLCVPSVALKTHCLLFDVDERLESLPFFVRYDLNRGLHSHHNANGKRLSQFEYRFSTVLFDAPFSFVTPDTMARNANALLQWDESATIYVCYPRTGFDALRQAFEKRGLTGKESGIQLEYNNPPRRMGLGEKREIKLYRFQRTMT